MLSIYRGGTGALLHAVDAPTLAGAKLAGAQLAGADLPFAILYGADLQRSDLQGAVLLDADLVDAHMQGCDLRGATLRGADLRGADLRGANLIGADLRAANLACTRLPGARLDGAVFTGVVLSDATYDDLTCWPHGLDPKRYGARLVSRPHDPVVVGGELPEAGESEPFASPDPPSAPTAGGPRQAIANIPANEDARLAALRSYEILDTPPEQEFDDLTRLASLICGTPMAVISLVDKERQWFKSRVGIEVTEMPRDAAFCMYTLLGPELFIVPDASRDGRFADDPQVISGPQLRFYAGMPIVSTGGHVLGTLCTMDHAPRELSDDQKEALAILSRQAGAHFQLRRTYSELQKLQELRDRLTQMIVHDLRQPLQSLMGGLHTMGALGQLNDDQREFLQMSLDGGEALLSMINDLLDISKLESGQLELDYSLLSPELLLEGPLTQLAQLAAQKNITLATVVEPGLPLVQGDREKLGRTLVNLVGNAVKFTPQGGTITLAARRGQVDQSVNFSVTDTGEGIPAAAFGKIFEKFGQVATRSGGQKMSTGLGLTFCKMVVEAHGGSLRVESELGIGSTFVITLPVGRTEVTQRMT